MLPERYSLPHFTRRPSIVEIAAEIAEISAALQRQ